MGNDALRNPFNEQLKDALGALSAGDMDRQAVLRVLTSDGPMAIAVDERTTPGRIGIRSVPTADGSSFLLGFTSAPEVLAFCPDDAVATLTTVQVLDKIRTDGYGGIVVDPAGPWVSFSKAEIWA